MGNTSKVPKCLDMSPEKALLVLRGKTSGERATRITQVHHKKLHFLFLPGNVDHGFAPIDLGVLAWLEFKWKEHLRRLFRPPARGHILTKPGFTALVSLGSDDLKDPVDRVTLLVRQVVVFAKKSFDSRLVGAKDRRRFRASDVIRVV